MRIDADHKLKLRIASLLGIESNLKIKKLPVSGNNRLYLVTTQKGRFVAKHYFSHVGDKRKRLYAEFAFVSFAHKYGIHCLPRPIARDDEGDIAVYSFLEGRRPSRSEISMKSIRTALNFLIKLNHHRDKACRDLPLAAESCFSIRAHIELIGKRVERLSEVTSNSAKKFIRGALVPVWKDIKRDILAGAVSQKLKMDDELPEGDRIISPSDFGFHNVLIESGNKFNFLDFEYAGWDDPAKTVGDFFSQVARPVPLEGLEMFVREVAGLTEQPLLMTVRIYLLLRLYRLKWCCIILNHFLPVGSWRRKFAGINVASAKKSQLDKAEKLLNSIPDLRT